MSDQLEPATLEDRIEKELQALRSAISIGGAAMGLVSFDQLAQKVGTRKVNAIKAWCARNRIHWMPDAQGPAHDHAVSHRPRVLSRHGCSERTELRCTGTGPFSTVSHG